MFNSESNSNLDNGTPKFVSEKASDVVSGGQTFTFTVTKGKKYMLIVGGVSTDNSINISGAYVEKSKVTTNGNGTKYDTVYMYGYIYVVVMTATSSSISVSSVWNDYAARITAQLWEI